MADIQGYFSNLMQDPMFNMGLNLIAQGKRGSLADAMSGFQNWQQNQQLSQFNKLKTEELQRQQEAQRKAQEAYAKLPGLRSQFTTPAVPAQPTYLMGDVAKMAGTEEMTVPARPEQFDAQGYQNGLQDIAMQVNPQGTLSSLLEQQQRDLQRTQAQEQWQQQISALEQSGSLPKQAIDLMKATGPEMFGKIGPGVLPKMLGTEKQSPTAIQEYEFAKQQGFGGSYLDFVKAKKERPQTIVVGGGPRGGGKPPTGYRYTAEGDLEPIPGGPAAAKAETVAEKEALLTGGIVQRADLVINKVDDAIKLTSPKTTGVAGATLGRIPGTDAYDLARMVDTVKANIGFGELQAMRQASPTGGALGQVAVQELNMLQAVIGSLDTSQSPDELKKNLNAVKKHYENWKSAVDKSKQQKPEGSWKDL